MSSDDGAPRRERIQEDDSSPSRRTRLPIWARVLAGRGWSVPVIALVVLVVTSTLVGAAASGGLTIPDPEPGVERTYDDTFRVLASNDPDPGRGSSTVRTYEYVDGNIRDVNRTVVTQPVQLWENSIRPRDALVIATESDMYQTGLGGLVTIPYQDRWHTLAEWNARWGDRELRIIPIYGADPSRATDTDGEYTVEVRNPNGWWDPVYDAEVERVGNEVTVTNPGTAMVHTAAYQTVTDRKRDIVHSLLRYSALAPDEETARRTAAVPMENGSELFPTVDGASVPLAWRGGSHALIRDAYVGVIDVVPGVWYRGRYVTQNWQVNTHVPWDYRIQLPAEYSVSDTCIVGNSTYPITRWAEYRILDANASVVNVTAGNITMQQWGPGEWTTLNYTSRLSEPRPLPVGNHTLTAELRIDVSLETYYGESSVNCTAWNRTRVINRSLTVTRSVPIETVNSENLSVDVQVFDRPGDDIVSVEWTGRQGLAAGAAGWEAVEVQVGEKTMYVTAPWRFFSVARNTGVEERTRGETTAVAASHSIDGRYPALLRYRMSPATVEVLADPPAERHVWWETTHVVENGSVPATPLPKTIVATENNATSPLYDQYAGVLKSTDTATGESVTTSTVDVWGRSVRTNQTVTRYQKAVLRVQIDDGTGTAAITLRARDGMPISGRAITLQGADVPLVVTDVNGTATVNITGTIVQAWFQGDDWRAPHEEYYLRTRAVGVSSATVVVDAIAVVGYLNDAITNVMLFVEWLVLGIFAVVWMRYMRRQEIS